MTFLPRNSEPKPIVEEPMLQIDLQSEEVWSPGFDPFLPHYDVFTLAYLADTRSLG